MIYVHCDQGSEAWHKARAGCCTASMFKIARAQTGGLDTRQKLYVEAIRAGRPEKAAQTLAGYKQRPSSQTVERALAGEKVGSPSELALNYAFRLAIERISGEPLDEGFETWAMQRGHEMEPIARARHEAEYGVWVERVGFVKTDDSLFGCSLDGVIEEDGCAEYKAFVDPAKLRTIHIDGDISDIRDQAMGCLWITGRKWIDVCLYCPALAAASKDLWCKRFERDDNYIAEMEAELVAFLDIVNSYEKQLRTPVTPASNDASWPFPQAAA